MNNITVVKIAGTDFTIDYQISICKIYDKLKIMGSKVGIRRVESQLVRTWNEGT